jgi:hypothetical protein
MYNTHEGFNPSQEELRKLYDSFIILVRELSYKYPKLNIVLRPHPGENMDSYRKELSDCKNVFVVNNGSVVEWILASKLIIHNGCTTGIESFLLDKPVISYIPFESESIKEFLPDEVSYKMSYISQIISFIDIYLHSGEIKINEDMSLRNKVFSNYYPIEESYSYENIFHLLDKIPNKKEPLSGESEFLNKLIRFEGTESEEAAINNKYDITPDEIKRFFRILDDIEGKETKIKIENFNPKVFVITAMD